MLLQTILLLCFDRIVTFHLKEPNNIPDELILFKNITRDVNPTWMAPLDLILFNNSDPSRTHQNNLSKAGLINLENLLLFQNVTSDEKTPDQLIQFKNLTRNVNPTRVPLLDLILFKKSGPTETYPTDLLKTPIIGLENLLLFQNITNDEKNQDVKELPENITNLTQLLVFDDERPVKGGSDGVLSLTLVNPTKKVTEKSIEELKRLSYMFLFDGQNITPKVVERRSQPGDSTIAEPTPSEKSHGDQRIDGLNTKTTQTQWNTPSNYFDYSMISQLMMQAWMNPLTSYYREVPKLALFYFGSLDHETPDTKKALLFLSSNNLPPETMPSVLQKLPPLTSSSPSYESSLKVLHLSPKEFTCLNKGFGPTQDKLTAKKMLQEALKCLEMGSFKF